MSTIVTAVIESISKDSIVASAGKEVFTLNADQIKKIVSKATLGAVIAFTKEDSGNIIDVKFENKKDTVVTKTRSSSPPARTPEQMKRTANSW